MKNIYKVLIIATAIYLGSVILGYPIAVIKLSVLSGNDFNVRPLDK